MYAAVVLIKCGANTLIKNVQNKTCFQYVMDDDKKRLLMDLAASTLQQSKTLPVSSQGPVGLGQSRGNGVDTHGGTNNEGGLQARPPINSPPR